MIVEETVAYLITSFMVVWLMINYLKKYFQYRASISYE